MANELPPPTGEQQAIKHDMKARPGSTRKVEAGPGTGKTTVLKMLAQQNPSKGLYVAYNASTKDDAKASLPKNVTPKTTHGLAYMALRMFDQKDRVKKRIFPDDITSNISFPLLGTGHLENVAATIVLEGLNKFYQSTDRDVTEEHFKGLGTPATQYGPLVRAAREVWAKQCSEGVFPILHDTYLKQLQMRDRIPCDYQYALFDEAQDANACTIDIMQRMGCPITWVGDSNQSIYAWRGAVNALGMIDAKTFPLMQSWRFGPSIAEIANAIKTGKLPTGSPAFDLVGNIRQDTNIGYNPPPGKRAIITRTNAEWFQHAIEFDGVVHVIGGIEETTKTLEAAFELFSSGSVPRNAPATIARFRHWEEMTKYAQEVTDRELLFIERIVTTYAKDLPRRINQLKLRHTDSDLNADLILSTGHKCKGKEFDIVILSDGFAGPHETDWHDLTIEERTAETNLLFVAATRARQYLVPNQAAETFLAAYKGQISRINKDNMGRLFGQPVGERTRSDLLNVINTYKNNLPAHPEAPQWKGARAVATPTAPSATTSQLQSPPAVTTAAATDITSARLTPPPPATNSHLAKPLGGALQDNASPPSEPGPDFNGGARSPFAQSKEFVPSQAERGGHPSGARQPLPAQARPPMSSSGASEKTWHTSNQADLYLLRSLAAGRDFTEISSKLKVPEEILVARGLKVLGSPEGTALLQKMQYNIHPESMGRMQSLAKALNNTVNIDPNIDISAPRSATRETIPEPQVA